MNRTLRVAGWIGIAGGVLLGSVQAEEKAGIPKEGRLSRPSSTLRVQTLPDVRIWRIGRMDYRKAVGISVTLERWVGPGEWERAPGKQIRVGEPVRTEAYSKKLKMNAAYETSWIFQGLETRESPRSHVVERAVWKNGAPAGVEQVVIQDLPTHWTEVILRHSQTGETLRVKLGEELP